MANNLSNLEKAIGVEFKNKNLLKVAVTHSTYGNEHNVKFNERLEFLGDAVLDVCVSKFLIASPNLDEGDMTKKRAQIVREEALDLYASKINLKEYLLLGHGEELSSGRDKPAIIADAFEALIGAIFQDFGFDYTYEVFLRLVVPYIDEVLKLKDYKTTLQELVQADKRTLNYKLINQSGPAHDMTFECAVYLEGDILMGTGIGKTKKEAEQNAAKEALNKIAR